jgi:hypothetical protein
MLTSQDNTFLDSAKFILEEELKIGVAWKVIEEKTNASLFQSNCGILYFVLYLIYVCSTELLEMAVSQSTVRLS